MSKKLYDHHRKPVGDAHISLDADGKEVVAVRMYSDKALFPNANVPIDVFDDWKKVRGIVEETERGQLDLWDLGP